MFIETSSDRFRREIAAHLAAFLCDPDGDEAVALQIIEIIAWRMTAREDYQVATVGAFVRINLAWLDKGRISYCELLERFTTAAAYAALGHEALASTLSVSVPDVRLP
ncbi:hypothetical protein [Asticcacaulis taihuensis]|jgi:hypothetical protein|uniref:Uncharacterized protein n=1 Tax=Asticcacaulis taihuensis TaxID=260084 RepID=A0A1G4PW33_9CAUL|nr:hypothetical protein [Asticcacaulis taihuensis]SCW36574.1 hypothetical protein SAMN02927928_0717 [Asticcacaulis taihuensis]